MTVKLNDISKKSAFRDRKSYSPEDIWAAGGTSAFGKKTGQSNAKVIEALKSVPEIEPFTEEEWKETVKHLADNK